MTGIQDTIQSALGARYVISEQIGEGAQGLVFRAHRHQAGDGTPADDEIALKLYTAEGQDERVQREIEAMRRIRHPSLATLIEAGEINVGADRFQYCAWEYIKGMPLDRRLSDGPLSPRTIAVVGRDAANGIAALWDDRIVHRDVNPKNLMLRTGEREAVLIDLGVARHIGRPSLTEYGFSWGTPGYLSPEQYRGVRDLSCKSDMFALGVVLLECALGSHPTKRSQHQLITGPPRSATLIPTLPAFLAEVIDSMLSSRAVSRPHPEEVVGNMTLFLEAI